jgi:hypothetical protein
VTISDIRRELSFFSADVVRLNAAAAPGSVELAETELGLALPASMRSVLAEFNGAFVVNEPILGVPPIQPALDLVSSTRQARTHWGAGGWAQEFVEVGNDGCGNPYVLLLDRQGDGGEAPVGFFDSGAMAMSEIVASSYLHYLWFLIQDVKWYHQANGKPRPRDDVVWTSTAVVVRPEALSPWRFNEAWMLAHDPALARWR